VRAFPRLWAHDLEDDDMLNMPSLSFGAAVAPGNRQSAIDLARKAEDRGFAGLYCPSAGDCIAFCQSALQATHSVRIGTAIQPIYFRVARSLADTAAFLHEVSGGRFQLGLGVSHQPVNDAYRVTAGKPIEDTRAYVSDMRAAVPFTGPLPRIVLAALRDKMVDLAVEVADGVAFAHTNRAILAKKIARIPEVRRKAGFSVSCTVSVVVETDETVAFEVLRRAMSLYAFLPHYRAYWRATGYHAEVDAIEAAIKSGEKDRIPALLSDRLLADICLFGSSSDIRDGVEAYLTMGVMPVLAPQSTSGDPLKALHEILDIYR